MTITLLVVAGLVVLALTLWDAFRPAREQNRRAKAGRERRGSAEDPFLQTPNDAYTGRRRPA